MKILFWCGDYYPNIGGAYAITDDLTKELLRLGHEVTVVTRSQPDAPASETWHGYRILRWDFPVLFEKLIVDDRFFDESPAILKQAIDLIGTFDVVCIGLLDMSAHYLLRLRPFFRFRLVLYLHGGDTRKLPACEPSYRRLLKAALRGADSIIPVSEELAREAAVFLPSAGRKMRVISNGIDIEGARRIEPRRQNREYIAFVGRLVEEKDAGTLIDAFQLVALRIPDVDLLLGGAGPERERLERKRAAGGLDGRVHFLGRLERHAAQAVINGALFLVVPSRTEGHPIVVMEALAAGKPVIGTGISAISRLIKDGIAGALFPPGDSGALGLLIEKYCNDGAALARLTAGVKALDLSGFAVSSLVPLHLQVFTKK